MFICNTCSLQYNTEEELTVHTEKCTANVAKPSSLELHICHFCDKSFMTSKELDEHACESNVEIMISWLNSIKKFMESMKDRTKPKAVGQCHYCLEELYTVDEVVEHRKTCEVLQTGKRIEQAFRLYKEMIGQPVDEPVTMTSMSSSFPKPSTSEENEQNKSSKKRVLDTEEDNAESNPKSSSSPKTSTSEENEQSKSLKKRVLDTEEDNAESSPETFSPLSKIRRTSNKDITDIETGQESVIHSKICDAKTKTCAKKTFDCVFCSRTFQSLDELKSHIIQCCKTFKK